MTWRPPAKQPSLFDKPKPTGAHRCPIAESGEHFPVRSDDGMRCALCAHMLQADKLPPVQRS